MPVTKSDLIEQLSTQTNLPKGKAELVINVIFDSMLGALQDGKRIEVRGFGSFEVRDYRAYEGRNPRTGDSVQVQPKKLPFFKVGKELRERVNLAAARAAAGQPSAAARQAAERMHPAPAHGTTFTAPGTTERVSPEVEPEGHPAEPEESPAPASTVPADIEPSSVEY